MTEEQLAGLNQSLQKFGDLKPIIIDKDNVIIDGHQRVHELRALGEEKVRAIIVDPKDNNERIMIRQVANKLIGEHNRAKDAVDFKNLFDSGDMEELAKMLAKPIEAFQKSMQIADFIAESKPHQTDAPKLEHHADTFLHGNIKQIYLYFTNEQYEDIIPRLEELMGKLGVDNHTDLVIKLVEIAEDN